MDERLVPDANDKTKKKYTLADDKKAAWLEEMRTRAEVAVAGWTEIHDRAVENLKFYAGDQWPSKVKAERETDERPCLTINQLPKFAAQVLGDAKQNKIGIKVRAVQGNAGARFKNVAGSSDYTNAQIMEGVIRNIEYVSKAERSYDLSMQHMTTGSFGFLRVIKRRSIPYGFEQELAIRAVRNQFSVLFDPTAMFDDEPDFANAGYCFVHTTMKRKIAEAKYPNKAFSDMGLDATSPAVNWWFTQDDVKVAEYWWREEEEAEYVKLSDGSIYELEDLEAMQEQLTAQGLTVVSSEKGTKFCVYQALVSGSDVLEGPIKWDGAYIPIVPVLGPELFLEGRMQYWSLFTHSKDAQRMYNYWRSAATETVALAPKAPWVAPAQAIAGHEKEWKDANKKPKAVLTYNYSADWPAPKREYMTENPAAEIQQSLQANDDIKNTVGMYDASLGRQSNETSGKAILARQREGDVGTFVFHDNLAKAIEHVGRILVDAIPRVYDTQRLVRLALPEDQEDFMRLNLRDLGTARYDVAIDSGPSYTTRRVEAAETLTEFVKAAPQVAQYVIDLIAQYMDWPGADVIAKRLKRLVPANLLSAKELEERMLEEQGRPQVPPTPQEQHEAQVAETTAKAELTDAEAKYVKAQAEMITARAQLMQASQADPKKIEETIAAGIAETLQGLSESRGRAAAH
jgi:hypothetical protein